MRILFVAPYFCWPISAGSSMRMYNVSKQLARQGHQLVLLAGARANTLPPHPHLHSLYEEIQAYAPPVWMPAWARLLRWAFSCQPYPATDLASSSLHDRLRELLGTRRFDLIWVNYFFLADALPFGLVQDTPVLVDEHEAHVLVWDEYSRRGNLLERSFARLNLARVRKLEERVLARVDALLCVSAQEAAFLCDRGPHRVKVWVVPNGVDADHFRPLLDQRHVPNRILLCGTMDVRRNVDAAIWFATRILPLVRNAVPAAELCIVGARPRRSVQNLQTTPGIHVTGIVADVRPYYAEAEVVVVPYRFGAGTRLKILEAMAMGSAIVSTGSGCRGIDVIDGQHLLVADDEVNFAKKVVELLSHRERAQALGANARRLVEERYRWDHIMDALVVKLQSICSREESACVPGPSGLRGSHAGL